VTGPERVHRSRQHAPPAPETGPGPARRPCESPTEVTGPGALRMPGRPRGPRPRPTPTPCHPGAGRGPAGGHETSYRGAVAAYRSVHPEDQIRAALPTTWRPCERGPRGWRQQAIDYLQRPLTGGRPQGRALAGPVAKPEATAMTIPTCSSAASRTTSSAPWPAGPQRAPVCPSQRETAPPHDGPTRRRRHSAPARQRPP